VTQAPELADDLAAAALVTARRLVGGGMLWASAAEVVALPAAALTGPDLVAMARAGCRAGDVLLLTAAADDATALELTARARIWGVTTVWVGSAARPPAGAADHVLWAADEPGARELLARWAGLARDRLEQPGLMPAVPVGTICTDEVCITCSDEGRPAEVVQPPDGPFGEALVRTATGEERVDVTLVGPVRPGDLVLIHAGSALVTLDPARPDLTGGPR
jgi:hydrogenase maturation factor